jgi:hypothetical protein
MELLYEHFPSRIKRVSDWVTILVGVFVFGLLGYQAIREIPYLIKTNESLQDLPVPIWPFKAILGIVCFLFCTNLIVNRRPK